MSTSIENTTKGERTQAKILDAATRLFAENGYDGTGIRDIEAAAKVKRGVVTYHFGNKEAVWKAMFAYAFLPSLEDLRSKRELLRALEPHKRARFLIEYFIRLSAERPYMNQLMVRENFTKSWRSTWIIKHFLKPVRALNQEIADNDPILTLFETDPHIRYAILGACNMVFSHRCEVNALFGEDVSDEEFIRKHVEAVLNLFDHLLQTEG